MSVIVEQLKRAKSIDLDAIGIKATEIHADAIVDLNRDQLRMGQKGNGDMKTYFKPSYLAYKRTLPSYFAGNKMDYYVSGDFQKSMFLRVSGKSTEIAAKDWKTPQLLELNGEEIFDLNNDFQAQAHELTTPTYFKVAHDFLHGK